jgi:hypothetical protein
MNIPIPPPKPPSNYIYISSPKYLQNILNNIRNFIIDGNLKATEDEIAILQKITNPESYKILINKTYPQLKDQTLLYSAALGNHVGIFKLLLSKGADLNLNKSSIYPISKKNGGEIFALLEPRLDGKFLDVGECSLCEEITSLYPFECGHLFCYDCSYKWVKECILTSTPKCPQLHCSAPVHINQLRNLLTPTEIDAYLNTLLRAALSASDDFIWCISCTSGFFTINNNKASSGSCASHSCPDCRHTWCALCNSVAHSGLTCEEAMIKWSIEDKENESWKLLNTKKCPSCKVHIQKSSGCSHINCKQCKYEFCWICMNKYQPGKHTYDINTCPCVK